MGGPDNIFYKWLGANLQHTLEASEYMLSILVIII